MTNENLPEALPAPESTPQPIADSTVETASEPIAEPESVVPGQPHEEPTESFADLLSEFERSHSHKGEPAQSSCRARSSPLSADQVFLDIGYKTEGVLPRSAFENNAEGVKPGDNFPVSVTGRNEEHYYELSRFKVAQPRDWSALEAAFAEKMAVVGTVTEVVKGGAQRGYRRARLYARQPQRNQATPPSWKSWSAPRSPAASPSSTSPMKMWSSIAAWFLKSRPAASARRALKP